MQIKTIAMYLPQFHRIPENDKWWGEGFTEWVSVRNGNKYCDEQEQPKKPLNDNYYNLLDKSVMEWQASLAIEYGIYGFAFYHYWFSKEKQILEKPAENLLKWKDLNMRFCFSWANQTWARSWVKYKELVNSWDDINEKKKEDDNGILLKQEYGGEEEWDRHYHYLLPFFKDERYIKEDNRPIFIIHFPNSISCLHDMMAYWNILAVRDGFDGIFFIVNNPEVYDCRCSARMLLEPVNAVGHVTPDRMDGIAAYDYDELWENILSSDIKVDIPTFLAGFVNYDDTPRRGMKGFFCKGVTPQKFENYFSQLVKKSKMLGNEYVFLNAWNEWGEGMYLEPDEEYKYGFLQAIKNVVFKKVEYDERYEKCNYIIPQEKHIEKEESLQNSLMAINKKYNIINKWYSLAEKDILLADYLDICGYKDIAIYGLGVMGNHLISDISKSTLNILYGIDQKADNKAFDFAVYTLQEDLPRADVIVVALAGNCDEVIDSIQNKVDVPVISLEELLYRACEYYFK